MDIPTVKLADGAEIPQIGLGFWKVKDEAEFNASFEAGIASGYRHFDTAQVYGNEQFLGTAWHKAELPREDIFITTKIAVEHFGHKHTLKSFEKSLENLQTDYVDLLLLHFPVTLLRNKSWEALEEIKASGKAKSIGVSNWTIRHLQDLEKHSQEMPVINQVELHVFLQQPELIEYCQERNVAVEAYSPLAHARAMDESVIAEIAAKHDKTYAQIMLRWCVQKGLIILPKSVTPSRVAENIAVFDFELDEEDMAKLAKLDRDLRTCWDPTHVP